MHTVRESIEKAGESLKEAGKHGTGHEASTGTGGPHTLFGGAHHTTGAQGQHMVGEGPTSYGTHTMGSRVQAAEESTEKAQRELQAATEQPAATHTMGSHIHSGQHAHPGEHIKQAMQGGESVMDKLKHAVGMK